MTFQDQVSVCPRCGNLAAVSDGFTIACQKCTYKISIPSFEAVSIAFYSAVVTILLLMLQKHIGLDELSKAQKVAEQWIEKRDEYLEVFGFLKSVGR